MRLPPVTAWTLLFALLLLAASARPGAGDAPEVGGHAITCSSERALRDYRTGLRHLYLGQANEAVQAFEEAARRDRGCAMAQWGLSRALARGGRDGDALAAATRAAELAAKADDREQKLVAAWEK